MQVTTLHKTSIGKKVIMAVTGLMLSGFVVAHLLGNLVVFLGPEAFNAYAKKLEDMGLVLWVARFGLLVVFLLHVWSAIVLTIENRRAKPEHYVSKKSVQNSVAARTMMISGLLVLAFLVYHLLHFTFRVTHPEISHITDATGHRDVYSMVVLSFQNIYISAVYVIAMFLMAMHLSHGLASMFQSLGLNNECLEPTLSRVAKIVAYAIFLAYTSIPVAANLGVLTV